MSLVNSNVPVFSMLADNLKEQIQTGTLKPGDMIPSESQLCTLYGVSRMTVRRGLALLIADGLIESYHGKGNFVAVPNLNQAILEFEDTNYRDESKENNKLLGIKRVKADIETADKLKLSLGTKVFMLKRLILGEHEAIEIKYLPYIKGKPIVENEIRYSAFPEMVAKHADAVIHKIEMGITARILQADEAELLNARLGDPCLCVIQVIYAKDDRPLGMSKKIYGKSMFELKAVSYPYAGRKVHD